MTETVSKTWIDDELATLPQLDTVFDRPALVFDAHSWQQEGYEVRDICTPKRADCQNIGIPIPSGKLLQLKGGRYSLVDETNTDTRRR